MVQLASPLRSTTGSAHTPWADGAQPKLVLVVAVLVVAVLVVAVLVVAVLLPCPQPRSWMDRCISCALLGSTSCRSAASWLAGRAPCCAAYSRMAVRQPGAWV